MRGFFESQIGPLALPDTRVRDVAGAATRSTDETAPGLADAVEPDWKRATVWEADNGVVTEVPAKLKKSVDYTVLVEKSGRQVSLTTQKPNVRVLVVEPRGGGATYCMLATFLPDKGWGGKARDLAVGGKSGDYSGLLVYSLPDGTSALGLHYDGGEAGHVIFFDNGHADRQDPDIRIAIGSSGGALTRAQDEKYTAIEEVYCVASAEGTKRGFWEEYDELKGGGPGSFGDGGRGGGNGGNGKPTVIPPVTVNAKKIFKNKDLTEAQWKELEKMIEKILDNCMGGNLYNALVKSGIQYGIAFHSGTKTSNYNGSTISLRESVADDVTLFHEMIHAYQHSNEPNSSSFADAQVNMEIETAIAALRYEMKKPNANQIYLKKYHERDMDIFNTLDGYLSIFGTDMSGEFLTQFQKDYLKARDVVEKKYKNNVSGVSPKFDSKRSLKSNFKNLTDLSRNC